MELPIRILAVVPEPVDAPWANAAAAAWTSIHTALRTHIDSGAIEIVRLQPATANALEQQAGRDPYNIVHVLARGTSRAAARHGTVTLEGSDRRARDLNAQNFARACARIPDLELVVLQSAGGPPAEFDVLRDTLLQQAASVACAPAATGAADPREAAEFARALYAGLASGKSLDSAFAIATRNPSALPDAAASVLPPQARLLLRPGQERPEQPVAPSRKEVPSIVTIPGRRSEERPTPPVSSVEDRQATDSERQLERKRAGSAFDVFLCHNIGDKPAVMAIGRRLMAHGVLPWLDQWELRPGTPWQRLLEEQIANIHSAAVFVGREGIGPWQRHELDGFLREFNKRGCPVIPVMLPGTAGEPELPLFLRGMTWVDFRVADPDPLAQLIWGITGQRPF